jgi:hypothetical protein
MLSDRGETNVPAEDRYLDAAARAVDGSLCFFNFNMYSGYVVSAPPRAASAGSPWRDVNSVRNVFVPGKWCGTVPFGRSTSVTA